MIGRMGRLPNMPSRGTPRRAIRIPDELWYAALAKAERSGEPLNEVIRRALERYVTGEDQEQEPD
jgi:predicted HicB family RNase H-like nuclease